MNEFARRLGVSHTLVQKAIKANKINEGWADGKIDPFVACEEWGKDYLPEFAHFKPLSSVAKGRTTNQKKADHDAHKATQLSAVLKAKKLKLEVEEKEGTLVNKKAVQATLRDFGAELRQSLMAIADRLADRIIHCKDRHVAHTLIYAEIEDVLIKTIDEYDKRDLV